MKFFTIAVFLFFGVSSFATETLEVEFTNGTAEFSVNIKEGNGSIYLNDLSIELPGVSHGSLHLVAEFGWGDQPYHFMCEQISEQLYGENTYKFASAYGYLESFSLFGGIFSKQQYFIVKRDGSYEISDSYPNSSYDSGFSCSETEFIY